MLRKDLDRLCQPVSPEEALENLQTLYDDLANSPGWGSEDDLTALNAAIEVLKECIKENKALVEYLSKHLQDGYDAHGHPSGRILPDDVLDRLGV